jgi:hypothetical protein
LSSLGEVGGGFENPVIGNKTKKIRKDYMK